MWFSLYVIDPLSLIISGTNSHQINQLNSITTSSVLPSDKSSLPKPTTRIKAIHKCSMGKSFLCHSISKTKAESQFLATRKED